MPTATDIAQLDRIHAADEVMTLLRATPQVVAVVALLELISDEQLSAVRERISLWVGTQEEPPTSVSGPTHRQQSRRRAH